MHMADRSGVDQSASAGLSRREAMHVGAFAVGGVMGAGLLAGCGGSDSHKTQTSPEKKAARGGVLRVGVPGGSATDTLDPPRIVSNVARVTALYDNVCERDADMKLQMRLAQEIEIGKDARTLTIRLRDGVEFHNGKALTVDDLLYNWRRIEDPKYPNNAVAKLGAIDLKRTRKLDKLTVRVALKGPNVQFPDNFGGTFGRIVPEGFDPKSPVGTGPFKYRSYRPGVTSTFVRNENYWGGDVLADELRILDIQDDTARVNALISGELDMMASLPASQIAQVQANPKFRALVGPTGTWLPFTMRVDKAPFDDVRVRQAFKLIVDRKQMLDQALSGHGDIANDVYSRYDAPTEGAIPQREQDIEQAKSLLRAAGRSGLTVEIVTAPIFVGLVEAAQVFAQQAKGAGVNVKVRRVDNATIYGPNFLKWPFSQDYWFADPFVLMADQTMIASASLNETHFNARGFDKLLDQISSELDEAKRNDLIIEAKRVVRDQGGYVIWGWPNIIDAYSTKVVGLKPSKYGTSLGNYDFARVGFAA